MFSVTNRIFGGQQAAMPVASGLLIACNLAAMDGLADERMVLLTDERSGSEGNRGR